MMPTTMMRMTPTTVAMMRMTPTTVAIKRMIQITRTIMTEPTTMEPTMMEPTTLEPTMMEQTMIFKERLERRSAAQTIQIKERLPQIKERLAQIKERLLQHTTSETERPTTHVSEMPSTNPTAANPTIHRDSSCKFTSCESLVPCTISVSLLWISS
jgi:hypothetical protein